MFIQILLMASAVVVERPTIRTVEIGGNRYTVAMMRDRTVTISGGESAAPHTAATLALMKTAALRASGCRLRDEYWSGTAMRGNLDCSAGFIP